MMTQCSTSILIEKCNLIDPIEVAFIYSSFLHDIISSFICDIISTSAYDSSHDYILLINLYTVFSYTYYKKLNLCFISLNLEVEQIINYCSKIIMMFVLSVHHFYHLLITSIYFNSGITHLSQFFIRYLQNFWIL